MSPSGLIRFLSVFYGPHEPFGVLDEKYGKNQVHEVSRIPLKTIETMSKIPTKAYPLPIHRAEFPGPTRQN